MTTADLVLFAMCFPAETRVSLDGADDGSGYVAVEHEGQWYTLEVHWPEGTAEVESTLDGRRVTYTLAQLRAIMRPIG
mgnify:CR=1 FL=1